MISEYLEEAEKWKVLSEWKVETITRTLRISSGDKEWRELTAMYCGRSREEVLLNKYSEEMYEVLKKKAREEGVGEEEIRSTQMKEIKLEKKIKKIEKDVLPEIERATEILKREIFQKKENKERLHAHFQRRRSAWGSYLIERVLVEVLPVNVRMYLVGGGGRPGEKVLFIWLDRKDAFSNVDLQFMGEADRVAVVEEGREATEEEMSVLQALWGNVSRTKKENGLTEDRTRVTGFKVPGATATP